MKFHAQLSIVLVVGLFAVVLFGAGGVTQSSYTTPAGMTYVLSPGTAGSCGEVAGGFACTVDGETVVSVWDDSGCDLVLNGASCMIDPDRSGEHYSRSFDQDHSELGAAVPDRLERGKSDQGKLGQGKLDQEKLGPDRLDPGRLDQDRLDPDRLHRDKQEAAAMMNSVPGASTLECEDRAFQISAGSAASCDANNGRVMTCSSTFEKDYARVSCAEGCIETRGAGGCFQVGTH